MVAVGWDVGVTVGVIVVVAELSAVWAPSGAGKSPPRLYEYLCRVSEYTNGQS